MLASMGADEYAEWIAFANVTGDLDPHFGAAQIACVVARARGAKNAKLADFYPVPPAPRRAASSAELAAKFGAIAARHNAKIQGS